MSSAKHFIAWCCNLMININNVLDSWIRGFIWGIAHKTCGSGRNFFCTFCSCLSLVKEWILGCRVSNFFISSEWDFKNIYLDWSWRDWPDCTTSHPMIARFSIKGQGKLPLHHLVLTPSSLYMFKLYKWTATGRNESDSAKGAPMALVVRFWLFAIYEVRICGSE